MQLLRPTIRGLVSGIGMFVAVAVAVGIPAAYFAIGSSAASDALAFKATLSAGHAAKYISAHERIWQYPHMRLAEAIEFPAGSGEPVRQRVTDLAGRLVLPETAEVAAPVQRVRVPITVDGEVVAWLRAESSLRPLLVSTGYVAAISVLLGLIAWLAVRMGPLRVLDQTMRRLSIQSGHLEATLENMSAALENMSQGLCLFDGAARLVISNHRYAAIYGLSPEHVRPGMSLAEITACRVAHGAAPVGTPDQYLDLHRLRTAARGSENRIQELSDGRLVAVSHRQMPDGGWLSIHDDVTEKHRSDERIVHMAKHDALTELPNRVLFREYMEGVLPRLERGKRMAVLTLDLDGFKSVNDTLGHPAGDELLRLVARRLRDNTRESDLVARLGGDEFAIIQTDADQPTDAALLADRLVAAIRAPFEIMGKQVEIGTSIGAVVTGDQASTCDELMRSADIALYRAKAGGRGTWCFFEPGMDAQIQQRRRLEVDLRRALAEEQFEVHYQPLMDAGTRRLTGFEALVRWRHPERGMLSPLEFIPLAEETGLIKAIGAWVLARACADAARWPAHVKVAVNLSPVQFINGNLVREVELALKASGMAAGRLELEITESVLMKNNDATLEILRRLHGLGVRIAMDDFGTGYSSLSYLRCFPFDKIKIDRSFVQNLPLESGSIEIIRAVVGLGKALGMEVLAEGVETDEQLGILIEEGCDELQGFLFSKPLPLAEAERLIALSATAPARDAGEMRSEPALSHHTLAEPG